jgi:AICAR transformylase/IMP cyclohydrolase PurH
MLTKGMLVQERDESLISEIKTITKREPSKEETEALESLGKYANT